VADTINKFIGGRELICEKLLSRIIEIRRCFSESAYFRHHEVLRLPIMIYVCKPERAFDQLDM